MCEPYDTQPRPYGMNFRDLPGLLEPWGFALSVALMLGVSAGLYLVFRRRGWL